MPAASSGQHPISQSDRNGPARWLFSSANCWRHSESVAFRIEIVASCTLRRVFSTHRVTHLLYAWQSTRHCRKDLSRHHGISTNSYFNLTA
jgi:hypothetical protein